MRRRPHSHSAACASKSRYSSEITTLQRCHNKDLEFLQNNTITHIVNCCAKEHPCLFSKLGVRYLNLNWHEHQSEEVLRIHEKFMPTVEEFVARAEEMSETVLIFCSNGQNRAFSLVVAFLMRR